MKAVLPWMFGVLGGFVLIAGAYFFQGALEAIIVKVIGWALLGVAFFLAGPRLVELMRARRRQVEEHWETHPGNPNRSGGD